MAWGGSIPFVGLGGKLANLKPTRKWIRDHISKSRSDPNMIELNLSTILRKKTFFCKTVIFELGKERFHQSEIYLSKFAQDYCIYYIYTYLIFLKRNKFKFLKSAFIKL